MLLILCCVFCFVCFRPASCAQCCLCLVPGVTCISGLSILDCPFGFLLRLYEKSTPWSSTSPYDLQPDSCVAMQNCRWRSNYQSDSVGIQFAPPHLYLAFLKPGPGFQTPYVMVFFVFNDLRLKMVVRFVDIGEISGPLLFKLSYHIKETLNYLGKCEKS